MDKKIVAIGGAVIKTAREELRKVIEQGKVEMLIHNGGSLFHDFQLSIDNSLQSQHSYPLSDLIEDPSINKKASIYVWDWLDGGVAPNKSITRLCQDLDIPVLMFTLLGGDFWHLFKGSNSWAYLGEEMFYYFEDLRKRFQNPFHYICMGSAVIHPEIFTKAIAGLDLPEFRADVVDFLDMYRPRTRIAKYGKYYLTTHKEYLRKWLKEL